MNNFAKRIAATALVSVALVSPLQAQDAHKQVAIGGHAVNTGAGQRRRSLSDAP